MHPNQQSSLEPFERFVDRAHLNAGGLPNSGQKLHLATLQGALPQAVATMRSHMFSVKPRSPPKCTLAWRARWPASSVCSRGSWNNSSSSSASKACDGRDSRGAASRSTESSTTTRQWVQETNHRAAALHSGARGSLQLKSDRSHLMPVTDAVQSFAGIANENEFYSHHYLAEVFKGDIKARLDGWLRRRLIPPITSSSSPVGLRAGLHCATSWAGRAMHRTSSPLLATCRPACCRRSVLTLATADDGEGARPWVAASRCGWRSANHTKPHHS